MITLTELQEKIIEQVSEVDLIDLLGLTTEDLVYAFQDKIEDRYDKLVSELELGDSTSSD
jgi:hypothetical protein